MKQIYDKSVLFKDSMLVDNNLNYALYLNDFLNMTIKHDMNFLDILQSENFDTNFNTYTNLTELKDIETAISKSTHNLKYIKDVQNRILDLNGKINEYIEQHLKKNEACKNWALALQHVCFPTWPYNNHYPIQNDLDYYYSSYPTPVKEYDACFCKNQCESKPKDLFEFTVMNEMEWIDYYVVRAIINKDITKFLYRLTEKIDLNIING